MAVLREDLAAYPEPGVALLRAVVALNVKELTPELTQLAATSNTWAPFVTVNRLFDAGTPELIAAYEKRAAGWTMPAARVAILEGLAQWKTKRSFEQFEALLKDTSLQVRESAWDTFLQTQSLYTPRERASRLSVGITAKPFEIRRTAYETYARSPASVRGELKLSKKNCTDEKNPKVRLACEHALLQVKP